MRHAANLVVGADGPFSGDRPLSERPPRRGDRCHRCRVRVLARLDVDGYHWVFRRDASAGVIPTNDGLWCSPPPPPRTWARAGSRACSAPCAVVGLADRLAAGPPPSGVRGFRALPGHLRVPWGPGWALVGDAGYWKDPIGAHGLTDALRDAEPWPPVSGRRRCRRSPRLSEYHETRNQVSPFFEVVDTIAGMRWTDAEIPELLLRLSSAMTDEVELLARLDDEPALAGHR